jgi:hypothetical protein
MQMIYCVQKSVDFLGAFAMHHPLTHQNSTTEFEEISSEFEEGLTHRFDSSSFFSNSSCYYKDIREF